MGGAAHGPSLGTNYPQDFYRLKQRMFFRVEKHVEAWKKSASFHLLVSMYGCNNFLAMALCQVKALEGR